jgi:hypothetical protein
VPQQNFAHFTSFPFSRHYFLCRFLLFFFFALCERVKCTVRLPSAFALLAAEFVCRSLKDVFRTSERGSLVPEGPAAAPEDDF